MENEDVGKMLAGIYGSFSKMHNGHLREFKDCLLNFYVNLDNVYDNGESISAILHFVENAFEASYLDDYSLNDFLTKFYQVAYYKGEASKLASWTKDSILRQMADLSFKYAQEEIDKSLKSIIDINSEKKGYLRKCFSSEEFKKYAEIIHNFSKDEDDSLHLPELQQFSKNFEELKRNVKMYDKSIDETKIELYNMMTNSNCKCVGGIGNFNSFLEKEIARVSAEEKTKTNPDGNGK